MKVNVSNNLYISDMEGCKRIGNEAIIHACKNPCYVKNSTNQKGSNVFESDLDLYLNMIDPDEPLFDLGLFKKSLQFIDKHINNREVVIHCNKGQSRSASIAALYLFKHESYRDAQDLIEGVYPNYKPSLGIDIYFENNWEKLTK